MSATGFSKAVLRTSENVNIVDFFWEGSFFFAPPYRTSFKFSNFTNTVKRRTVILHSIL
jgi:hypothetical protein